MDEQEKRTRSMLNLSYHYMDEDEIVGKKELLRAAMIEHELQVHTRRPRCMRRLSNSRHQCARCAGNDFGKSKLSHSVFDHLGWAVPATSGLRWPSFWVLLSFPYPRADTYQGTLSYYENSIPELKHFLNEYNRNLHVREKTPYASDSTVFLLLWPREVDVQCKCDVILGE